MGRLNYFFYDYTLEGLKNTLKRKSHWDIKNSQKFELEMYKLLNGALDDFRKQALQKLTIDERNSFITETNEEVQASLNGISTSTDRFDETLSNIGERFLAESIFSYALIKEKPVWQVPDFGIQKEDFISTINNPVVFLEGLTKFANLNSLKDEFYEYYENMGYTVDKKEELCTDAFYINDYIDENIQSLSSLERNELVKLQNSPENIITQTIYFSDNLFKTIEDQIEYSKALITAYLNANPGDIKNYLKPVKTKLNEILSNRPLFKNYPGIKKPLKELQKTLRPANINTLIITSNTASPLTDLHFNLSITGSAKQNEISKIVFNTLKEYSTCTKPEVNQALGISPHLQKITWNGTLYELKYFVKNLTEIFPAMQGGKDIKFKVAANCFIDKNKQDIKSEQIRKAQKPAKFINERFDNMKKEIQ